MNLGWGEMDSEGVSRGAAGSAEECAEMTHVPSPRLRAWAGVFASWAWVRSATDSNGIARCVRSVGGESPAVTLRRGDMGRLRQMNEWVDHQGEGPS